MARKCEEVFEKRAFSPVENNDAAICGHLPVLKGSGAFCRLPRRYAERSGNDINSLTPRAAKHDLLSTIKASAGILVWVVHSKLLKQVWVAPTSLNASIRMNNLFRVYT
jgi:hypothetical protein